MEKMMDWLLENPWVAYGYSVGFLFFSMGAILVMNSAEPKCDPGCYPALSVSRNAAKVIFGVSTIGCFTSGSVALIKEPRK